MNGGELQLSPEEQAYYDAWMKEATPNENHKELAKLAGEWTFTTKWWTKPGASPRESTGTSTFTVIFGGRFVQQKMQGNVMGRTYEAMGLHGYDNLKKKYVSMWVDNMHTSLITSEGRWDEAAKSITMYSDHMDPMTGSQKRARTVVRWVDDNTHIFEWHESGTDGKEFRSSEITYVRRRE